jgi:regulation of enolase protein 1 (concanavalin A-like superfamily)
MSRPKLQVRSSGLKSLDYARILAPANRMKLLWRLILTLVACVTATACAGQVVFQDDFRGKLGDGWSWRREHREAWRVTERGLEVRLEPGNMWGPANDARNLLLRPAPENTNDEIEVSVTVRNHPTGQYEQTDLVWYYDDGHMVKVGQELVDGKLSMVMGREEADKTRTISITGIGSDVVRLKLSVKGNQIRGAFQIPGSEEWQAVGQCDLPMPPGGKAMISLQFYQGPPQTEHWALVSAFCVSTRSISQAHSPPKS